MQFNALCRLPERVDYLEHSFNFVYIEINLPETKWSLQTRLYSLRLQFFLFTAATNFCLWAGSFQTLC